MLDSRASLLRAALGFALIPANEPQLRLLHRWMDTWLGIGHVVAGVARHGYDLELRRYDGQGWRAIFFQSGFEHSLTSHAGAAWARSPWEVVQRAAGDALRKLESPDAAPHLPAVSALDCACDETLDGIAFDVKRVRTRLKRPAKQRRDRVTLVRHRELS